MRLAPPAAPPDRWITAPQAAYLLGCSPGYAKKLAAEGLLTTRRVGDSWVRFLAADVEELAAKTIRERTRTGGDA
jgi:hypothetical protein